MLTASVQTDSTKLMTDAITPYLPAMKRCSPAVFNTVVDALGNQDWSTVDRELHDHMTESERGAIAAHQSMREAILLTYETRRSFKRDLLKAVMGIAVSLV